VLSDEVALCLWEIEKTGHTFYRILSPLRGGLKRGRETRATLYQLTHTTNVILGE
jgi:hypothetical protein